MYPNIPLPPQTPQTMETHSGTGSILGAVLAIYGAVTQPSVVAQIPGKAGAILGALGAASPIVTAGIGVVGALIAARSMPRGSAKVPAVNAE